MSTSSELDDRLETQQRAIDRLERKVEALADAVGAEFAGPCTRCEDGVVLFRDGALVCTGCSFSRAL